MRVPFAGLSWDFRIGNERIKRFSSFQSFSFYSFFFCLRQYVTTDKSLVRFRISECGKRDESRDH